MPEMSIHEAREVVESFKKEHGEDWQTHLMAHLKEQAKNAIVFTSGRAGDTERMEERRENARRVREAHGWQSFEDQRKTYTADQIPTREEIDDFVKNGMRKPVPTE